MYGLGQDLDGLMMGAAGWRAGAATLPRRLGCSLSDGGEEAEAGMPVVRRGIASA